MSTNYYWNSKGSKLTKNTPYTVNLHIGKTAGGWSFMVQAYKTKVTEIQVLPVAEGVTMGPPCELDISLTSWADWKKFLLTQGGVITDEYDSTMAPAQFIEMVEKHHHPEGTWGPTGTRLRNDYDEGLKSTWAESFRDSAKYWKDSEGYSCSLPAFS